jgi:acyl transferase domain-containing protein/acyl-CoA synthetase (AMP-forming)/AMP-acid ligase II
MMSQFPPISSEGQEQLDHISTLAELLQWRAELHPEKVAYRFLADDNQEKDVLTYRALHQKAAAIALRLAAKGAAGDRVILLYPPGLDFICAFFGCMYANMVAVPIAQVRGNKRIEHLERIVEDCSARFMLTTEEFSKRLASALADSQCLRELKWETTDSIGAELSAIITNSGANADSLAFLQYTSGSTSLPKGVMVTHRNLMHNESAIKQQLGIPNGATILSWLPSYHDMGLIGGVIQAVYNGAHCVMMAPAAFIQRPALWFQAISRYKAFVSGGPNFGYELCIRQINPEQLHGVDLSSWGVATNGAEPVRAETMERFSAMFAKYGFRRESFSPCYGLAEGTLLVSCQSIPGPGPRIVPFHREALQRNRIEAGNEGGQKLTSVGRGVPGQKILIVDPEAKTPCEPDKIGEIWVSGASVAQGYWNNSTATANTFHARLAGDGKDLFLRTGDLGFFNDQELFVTGRLKELIIINGRNHYPQDIELTVANSHPALQPGAGVAFSILVNDEEKMLIAFEVKRSFLDVDEDAVRDCVREAVAKEHEAAVHEVVLVRPGSIPKTSSGKIQRILCRERFVAGTLQTIGSRAKARSLAATADKSPQAEVNPTAAENRAVVQRITEIISAQVVRSARLCREDVPVDKDLFSLGIDSVKGIEIIGGLETTLGLSLSPTLLYEAPTIERLARTLAERSGLKESSMAFMRRESAVTTPANNGDQAVEGQSAREQLKEKVRPEDIAVIGMGCRFPGAPNLESYWRLLEEGRDAISEIPSLRWDWTRNYDSNPEAEGKTYSKWGGFLEEIDGFDAPFFNISAREAKLMDPQQRLFLEVAWETIEHAGYPAKTLSESEVGVFAGCSTNGYYERIAPSLRQSDYAAGVGNQNPIIANRISFFMNLHGPSMLVDTLCSSSLVAMHLACQSLRLGECKLALAGGVNLILSPEYYLGLSRMKAHAPDGRCKTFDRRANGFVSGEGAGVLLLKPLREALEDRDTVYAIIKGSAINHGGQTNGLTAPNPQAQAKLIQQALKASSVSADSITYVEAHGTGTALGDPIEVAGLTEAFKGSIGRKQWCAIGSVKTNIGHLEPAAGVAGVIKVILSMQHRKLPASLHFESANPLIRFDESPFYVNTSLRSWDVDGPRRAGISSFGLGGANCHIILEEGHASPETIQAQDGETEFKLFTLSARTDTALRALAQRHVDSLQQTNMRLDDICYTANTGRSRFSKTVALVTNSNSHLRESLQEFISGKARHITGTEKSIKSPEVAFLFTGQGGKAIGLGKQLFETNAVFRQAMEKCDALSRAYVEDGLISFLFGPVETGDLNAAYLQPAIFALQYSLTELWRSWGVVPSVVIGHSLGEYAAACVAGIFSLEDGMQLVAERARFMQELSRKGGMAAVFTDEENVQSVIEPFREQISIAAVNSPRNTVIAGDSATLETVLERFRLRDVASEMLHVSHAFHSPLMEPILGRLQEVASHVIFRAPAVPMISTVTGKMFDAGNPPNAAYWCLHARRPVQFVESIRRLGEQGCSALLEIGPSGGLLGSAKRCLGREDILLLPSLKDQDDSLKTLLTALGELYCRGAQVDWSGVYQNRKYRRVALPSYPFERQKHWVEGAYHEPVRAPIDHVQASDEYTYHYPIYEDRTHSGNGTFMTSAVPAAPIPAHSNGHEILSRHDSILQVLRGKLARLLEMEERDVDDSIPFLELGADSLILLEALQGVQDVFGLKLGIRQLFEEFTNLQSLASHINQLLPQDAKFAAATPKALPVAGNHASQRNEPVWAPERMIAHMPGTPHNKGNQSRADISGLMTQQLETMNEIIFQQLQILQRK